MEKATISQLKNSLSAYLKRVRAGQTVLILDREEPIAVLVDEPAQTFVQRELELDPAMILRCSSL